ncbi:MAG: hypothetical protein EAY75_09205 [Bacteroidetes bacterium]|nr:MAG: hypothetical protein EAY75_09205 [Bacteroidota bacterium]
MRGCRRPKGTIAYTYDAAGTKLRKTVTEGATVTTTLYLGVSIYEQTCNTPLALQFIARGKSRFRPLPPQRAGQRIIC